MRPLVRSLLDLARHPQRQRDPRRRSLAVCLVGLVALAAAIFPLAYPATAVAQAVFAADSELRDTVRLYAADRAALLRRYDVEYSAARRDRMRAFYEDWTARLDRIDFDALSQEGRVDYVLMSHEVRYELAVLDREERLYQEMAPWLPFALTIADL